MHTFAFADDQSTVDTTLNMIKENIFDEIPFAVEISHQCCATIQQCYNLDGEPDDDLTNINIMESECMHEFEGSGISSDEFLKPLKFKKVNISSS